MKGVSFQKILQLLQKYYGNIIQLVAYSTRIGGVREYYEKR